MDWATTIKGARIKNGLKQSVLADLLNMDQATISRWERGACSPSVAMQHQILSRIERITYADFEVQLLYDTIRRSPEPVLITSPGYMRSEHVSIPMERVYDSLGVDTAVYDWHASACSTPEGRRLMEVLYGNGGAALDPCLVYVLWECPFQIGDTLVHCRDVGTQVRLFNERYRLIVRTEKVEPYVDQECFAEIHMITKKAQRVSLK